MAILFGVFGGYINPHESQWTLSVGVQGDRKKNWYRAVNRAIGRYQAIPISLIKAFLNLKP